MINITIDELILHGIDPDDTVAFQTALEATLTGLASSYNGELGSGRAYELHGTPVQLEGAVTGDGLARDVARSAWHSIVPEGGSRAD